MRKPATPGPATLITHEPGEPDSPAHQALDEAPRVRVGDTLDRYVVERPLGQGATATVWQVRHTTLGTTHALKLLKHASGQTLARQLAEGRLLAGWHHPHIVRVQDAFEVHGALALVMELVEGATLAEHLHTHSPLPVEDVARLARQLLSALDHAHAHGVVHRDLKPQNILISEEAGAWHARVSDFGIAKISNSATTHRGTRTGALLGTPAYMAPEQLEGASEVDGRADLFALGVILYEASCGARPFRGDTMWSLIDALRSGRFEPLEQRRPELSAPLHALVKACLRPSPTRRVPDCQTATAILDGQPWAAPGEEDEAPVIAPPHTSPRAWQRAVAGVAAAGVGACAALGALAWSRHDDATRAHARLDAQTHLMQRVARTDARARLERRAWAAAARDPSEALALLRASASLTGSPGQALQRPEVMALVRQGVSRVVPTTHEVQRVRVSKDGARAVLVLGDGGLVAIRPDTGESLWARDSGLEAKLHIELVREDRWIIGFRRAQLRHAHAERTMPGRIFDAQTGAIVHTLSHGKNTNDLVVSPDGERAVTNAYAKPLRLWNLRTGEPGALIETPQALTEARGRWSPRGDRFAALTRHVGEVLVWDTTTWRPLYKLDIPDPPGLAEVAFSPRGDALFATRHGVLRAWDPYTGAQLAEAHLPTGKHLIVSPRGDRLFVGGEAEGVRALTWPGLKELGRLRGHDARIIRLAMDARGELLVSASGDHTATLWSPATAAPLMRLRGHRSWALAAAITREGERPVVVTGGRDRTLRLWPLPGVGARQDPFDFAPTAARAWSRDGRTLVARAPDGQLWIKRGDQPAWTLPRSDAPLKRIQLSDDGASLLRCTIIERQTRCDLHDLSDRDAAPKTIGAARFVCLGAGGEVTLQTTGRHITNHQSGARWEVKHPASIAGVTCGPSQVFVLDAILGWQLLDRATGARVGGGTFEATPSSRHTLRGGQDLLIGYWRPQIERRRMRDGALLWRRDDLRDAAARVEVSPDERHIAVASPDASVTLLDAETGRTLHALEGHLTDVVEMAFSADSARLATASKDGDVRLWDVRTGEPLGALMALSTVHMLRFLDGGDALAGWDATGALWRWPLKDHLVPAAALSRWTGALTNLRVCRDTHAVVPVIPFPDPASVWATPAQCAATPRRDERP